MMILFSLKHLPSLVLFLFISFQLCVSSVVVDSYWPRLIENQCLEPVYGDACICLEKRPNLKQLDCKNVSCNTEFSGYLKHVQGYNIKRLNLENMDLKYVPRVFFDGDFTWLEISTSILEERLFQDIPENNKLEHLMLNEVKIADEQWDWQSIAPLKKLATLRIRNIALGGLQNFTLFENTMKHIVLHGCDVRELRNDQFQNYGKLEMIDIRHDRLKELKRSMFPVLCKLRIMIFRNNHLTSLPANLFEGMSNLRVIDFQQNRLTILHENTFKPIKSPVLFLQENPRKCDCRIKWTLNITMVKGKCFEPEDFKGKELSHLSEEDFKHC